MGMAYASADFAIARAGAGTCMELAITAVPALLIPLPSARRDHQTANAPTPAEVGAADTVPQNKLDSRKLVEYMKDIIANAKKRATMREAMRHFARPDSAERLADILEEGKDSPDADL